ncbi:YybH family protein [Bythopirellula polymerisocia]|uniref:SnoaL-like domain protein n=1 Tax=Bythopirellula polymerisocia TaxID=2528003 RepID=A0A5C6D662_9BACT|nr:SgcJ/EcaC family oxidoreductase [Bythopirellula polymerisocia]TWU30359.1 SnoaL-like domain protein [Bythopirellula polymerisocia]
MKRMVWGIVAVLFAVCGSEAAIAADGAADKAAIEKSVASYVAAFNAHDSAALAAHWSPEAVYTNPRTGDQLFGQEAIKQEFDALLAEAKDAKLDVAVTSIDFVSPQVAVENGVATVTGSKGEAEVTSYQAVHIKQGGKWLLDRVSEEEVVATSSHYDQLKDLEWMIGTWLDADGENQIETTCQWTRNNNFMLRAFKVSVEDQIDTSGLQLIGWDPAQGKIRSWAFDSNGGFAEGTWTRKKDRWLIDSNATLPDGQMASSMNIMTKIDENTFGWQMTGREVDGKILPNINEVKVSRVTVPE